MSNEREKLRYHDDIYPRGSTHLLGTLACLFSCCVVKGRDQMLRDFSGLRITWLRTAMAEDDSCK